MMWILNKKVRFLSFTYYLFSFRQHYQCFKHWWFETGKSVFSFQVTVAIYPIILNMNYEVFILVITSVPNFLIVAYVPIMRYDRGFFLTKHRLLQEELPSISATQYALERVGIYLLRSINQNNKIQLLLRSFKWGEVMCCDCIYKHPGMPTNEFTDNHFAALLNKINIKTKNGVSKSCSVTLTSTYWSIKHDVDRVVDTTPYQARWETNEFFKRDQIP